MMTRWPANLTALALPLAAGAAAAAPHNPFAVDVDVDVDTEALQQVLDGFRADIGTFGATLSLRVPGHDDVHLASGVDDRDPETPMPVDGTFPIDKVTMNFVGVLALQLVDEGRLALDDTIEEWLPEIPEAAEITVEMLLTHTSGIAAWRDAPGYIPMIVDDPAHVYAPEEVLAATLAMPRTHAPGESFEWSDGGFIALGLLLERELGQDLAAILAEQTAAPLGLDDTVLSSDYSEVTRHAWLALDGPSEPVDVLDLPGNAYATSQWASGGMVSAATDLLDWSDALYSGDVLSAETTAAMAEMRTTWLSGMATHQHGLGVTGYCLRPDGCALGDVELLGYAGFLPGLTRVAYHPASGISMVVHANGPGTIDTGPFVTFATAVLDSLGVGSGGEPVSSGDRLTLRMGMPYNDEELIAGSGSRYTPAVFDFVHQLGRRSGWTVDIEPVWQSADGTAFSVQPDGEQQVVQAVIDGDVDFAWIGTRVLDTFGVTSFRALHAPFLVDSYELQQAILESDIPAEMLSGLDAVDLDGLAILGGGLRKPIGRDGPLLRPDDFAGSTFQIYRSATQAAAVTALGATPTDVTAGVRDAGLASGEIDGHEHSLNIYVVRGNTALAPYVTANVNLWPETVALIANPDALAALTDEQQAWLRERAAFASSRSVGWYDQEADLLTLACAQGASVVEASDDDLAALRQAVEPVYEELRADPVTASFIDRIEELKSLMAAEAPPIPDGCSEAATTTPAGDERLPDGTYTTDPVTQEQAADALRGRALAESTIAEVFSVVGAYANSDETMTFTLDLAEGRFALTERSDDGSINVCCTGAVTVLDDNRVRLGQYVFEYMIDGRTLTLRADANDEQVQAFCAADLAACFGVVGFESAPFTKIE